MALRTRIIILYEICVNVLQCQQMTDIVNILSICIFCFQCSFFIIICYNQNNIRQSFTCLPCGSPEKHMDSFTLTKKKLAQLNQTGFFRRESSRDCHSKCVTKLLQSRGESMASYAKPLSFRSDSGHRYQSNPEFRTATLNPVSKQLIAAQISALFTGINQLDRPLCCLARLPPASQGSSV